MKENTPTPTASSPPSFMMNSAAPEPNTEDEADRPKKLPPDDKDKMEIRSATIVKAMDRLKQMAEYLGKIDDVIKGNLPDFIARHPMGETIDKFLALEAQVYAVEEQVKLLKSRMAYAREVSFPGRMDAEEQKTTTSSETGNRMTRTARFFASIIPDQTPGADPTGKAFKWLRDNDLGPLIKETVNASSLSAAAKELMENGRELPEELFKVHMKDGVSITKGKKT